jgi:hypothetical protein
MDNRYYKNIYSTHCARRAICNNFKQDYIFTRLEHLIICIKAYVKTTPNNQLITWGNTFCRTSDILL